MTMGLACDRDGYDLRIPPCGRCGSRGCPNRSTCKFDPALRVGRVNSKGIVRCDPAESGQDVPNRLFGATINHEGDAV